jgi:hypothetical protein
MTSISITIHTAGAFDGWSEADIAAIDMLNTEAQIARLITDRVVEATGVEAVEVEVRSEDRGDFWTISGAASEMEQRDLDEVVRETLIDFPWYDGNVWAVTK